MVNLRHILKFTSSVSMYFKNVGKRLRKMKYSQESCTSNIDFLSSLFSQYRISIISNPVLVIPEVKHVLFLDVYLIFKILLYIFSHYKGHTVTAPIIVALNQRGLLILGCKNQGLNNIFWSKASLQQKPQTFFEDIFNRYCEILDS